jgi:hypothetical protein
MVPLKSTTEDDDLCGGSIGVVHFTCRKQVDHALDSTNATQLEDHGMWQNSYHKIIK